MRNLYLHLGCFTPADLGSSWQSSGLHVLLRGYNLWYLQLWQSPTRPRAPGLLRQEEVSLPAASCCPLHAPHYSRHRCLPCISGQTICIKTLQIFQHWRNFQSSCERPRVSHSAKQTGKSKLWKEKLHFVLILKKPRKFVWSPPCLVQQMDFTAPISTGPADLWWQRSCHYLSWAIQCSGKTWSLSHITLH